MVALRPASKKLLQVGLLVVAAVLMILGVLYLTRAASDLPNWVPGYNEHLTRHRVKHGVAAVLVSLDLVVVVWIMAFVAPRGSTVRGILVGAVARLRDRDPSEVLAEAQAAALATGSMPAAHAAPRRERRTVVYADDRASIDTFSGRGVALSARLADAREPGERPTR